MYEYQLPLSLTPCQLDLLRYRLLYPVCYWLPLSLYAYGIINKVTNNKSNTG